MLYVGGMPSADGTTSSREFGDFVETHPRRPQHHGVAEVVDAPAAGPTGELGVLPRRQPLVVFTGELGELLDDHGPSRHVDADRQRLGGEHDLDQTLDETRLDDLLHRRHHAGVVGGDAALELRTNWVVAEHLEVGVVEPASRSSTIAGSRPLGRS
jgi:hypothetical protein